MVEPRQVATRGDGHGGLPDASAGELVQRLSEQVGTLVRDEMRLARAELVEKGRTAGVGAGMFGGGGVVALYGAGALIAAIILGLAEGMPGWLSALIVAVVLFAVAGGLAIAGRGRVKQAAPPIPAEAVRGVRRDVDTVKTAVKERGQQ